MPATSASGVTSPSRCCRIGSPAILRLSSASNGRRAPSRRCLTDVLALYDFGKYDGSLCAVTELLEGESLDRRIAREKITWRQAAEIAAAIADGLSAAHARGIVHRDLKPTNVFVTRDGLVKVIYFGLARPAVLGVPAPGAPTVLANTEPGTVLGTIGTCRRNRSEEKRSTRAAISFLSGADCTKC